MIPSNIQFNTGLNKQPKVSLGYRILEYIQKHPQCAKDTSIPQLVKRIQSQVATDYTELAVKYEFRKLLTNNVIVRSPNSGKRKHQYFYNNYLSPSFPQSLKESITPEEQKRLDEIKSHLEDIQSKAKKEEESIKKLKSEKTTVPLAKEELKELVNNNPITAKISKDGKSLNLAITININLNNAKEA